MKKPGHNEALGPADPSMSFNLIYHADVKRVDLPKINMKDRSMIKRAIEERLATRPEVFGKPLQRTLKGYWRLRVGEYRVVFRIAENDILVLGIVHRKEVYQRVKKRIER